MLEKEVLGKGEEVYVSILISQLFPLSFQSEFHKHF